MFPQRMFPGRMFPARMFVKKPSGTVVPPQPSSGFGQTQFRIRSRVKAAFGAVEFNIAKRDPSSS